MLIMKKWIHSNNISPWFHIEQGYNAFNIDDEMLLNLKEYHYDMFVFICEHLGQLKIVINNSTIISGNKILPDSLKQINTLTTLQEMLDCIFRYIYPEIEIK